MSTALVRLLSFLGLVAAAALPTASEKPKADGKPCKGCCGVETAVPVPPELRHQLPKNILVVLRGHSFSRTYRHFSYNYQRTHANFFSHLVEPWRQQGHAVDVGIVTFENKWLSEIESIYQPEFLTVADYSWKEHNETKHQIMLKALHEISARGGESRWDVIALTRFDLEMHQPVTSFAVDFTKLNFGWKEVSNKSWQELPRVSDALQIFPAVYLPKYEASVSKMASDAGLHTGSKRVTFNNGHRVLADMEGVDVDREVNFLVGRACMSKWYLYNPIFRQAVSEKRLAQQAVLPGAGSGWASPAPPAPSQPPTDKGPTTRQKGSCGRGALVPVPAHLADPAPQRILVVLRGLSYSPEYKDFHYNFERTHENFFSHVVEPWRQQGHSVDVGIVTFDNEKRRQVEEAYQPVEFMHVANFSFAWPNVTKHHILLEAIQVIVASKGELRWDVIALIRFDIALRAPVTGFAIDFGRLNFGWKEGSSSGWEGHPLVPDAIHVFPSKYLSRYEATARRMISNVRAGGSARKRASYNSPNRILLDMEGVHLKTEVNLLVSGTCKSSWFLPNPIYREAVSADQAKRQPPLPDEVPRPA